MMKLWAPIDPGVIPRSPAGAARAVLERGLKVREVVELVELEAKIARLAALEEQMDTDFTPAGR